MKVSYIDPEIQKWLFEYLKENGTLKLNQVTALRAHLASSGAITQASMISLLNDNLPGRIPTIKVSFNEKKLREYFPPNYTSTEMRNIIEDLLLEWKQAHNGGGE